MCYPTEPVAQPIDSQLSALRLRLRTQNLQAQSYQNQVREAKLSIAKSTQEADKIALTDAIFRRNRAETLYERELAQMRTLQGVIQALEDAIRNLEMVEHLQAAQLTLTDVLKSMPEDRVAQIMDGIRDCMDEAQDIDNLLAEPLRVKVDEEVEENVTLDLLDSLTVPLAKTLPDTGSTVGIRQRVPN